MMKKNHQKKWAKNDVPAKLAVYLADVVATANSKNTVAEWLATFLIKVVPSSQHSHALLIDASHVQGHFGFQLFEIYKIHMF